MARRLAAAVGALALAAGCAGSETSGAEVEATDRGFSPATITVGRGEEVTFRNTGDDDVWPASDDHPTHERYPEFDPRKSVIAGESWSFTFERPGRWRYHNHLAPDQKGLVVVK